MAETNVERLRAGYEAVDRGDFEAVRGLFHPDVQLFDRPEVPDAASYRGWEGMASTVRDSQQTFEDFRFEPEQFFERGDRIVAIVTMTGRGRASGVPVEERIAHLWTLRDGRAVELRAFTDPADALEAAGLPRALSEQ
jgi:ketosteroid isomerase-like protein